MFVSVHDSDNHGIASLYLCRPFLLVECYLLLGTIFSPTSSVNSNTSIVYMTIYLALHGSPDGGEGHSYCMTLMDKDGKESLSLQTNGFFPME